MKIDRGLLNQVGLGLLLPVKPKVSKIKVKYKKLKVCKARIGCHDEGSRRAWRSRRSRVELG